MTAEESNNKVVPFFLPVGRDFYIAALKLVKQPVPWYVMQPFSWYVENLKQNNSLAPYWREWDAALNEAKILLGTSESDVMRNLDAFEIKLVYRSYLSMAYILFWYIRYNSQINVEKVMEDILIRLKIELAEPISPSHIIENAPGAVGQAPNIVRRESLLKLGANMEAALGTLALTIKFYTEAYKDAPPYQPGGIFYPIML
jgi:hypothetical protein